MSCAALEAVDTDAQPTCSRCGAHLRRGNGADLCDPCHATIESCRPFIEREEAPREQAPHGVNLLELIAGLMLTHAALHPGAKLYVREALAEHGVDADHVAIWRAAGKLRRRHGLILRGESRQPGYALSEWRDLLRVPVLLPHPPATSAKWQQLCLFEVDAMTHLRLVSAPIDSH